MGNSAFLQLCNFRALQKITRDAEGLLQVYKLGTLCKRPLTNSQDQCGYAGTYEGHFWPFWL